MLVSYGGYTRAGVFSNAASAQNIQQTSVRRQVPGACGNSTPRCGMGSKGRQIHRRLRSELVPVLVPVSVPGQSVDPIGSNTQ